MSNIGTHDTTHVISIDVGIKNLSYCILTNDSGNGYSLAKPSIQTTQSWDNISLYEDPKPLCGHTISRRKKGVDETKPCVSMAKYVGGIDSVDSVDSVVS